MARITTTKPHTSGIALGGIGSGSVELMPDGEFHYWLIANQPRITESCCEAKVDDGEILETLREVLALDPRPSYHNDPRREYGMSFAGFNVKFRVDDQGDVPTIYVTEIL